MLNQELDLQKKLEELAKETAKETAKATTEAMFKELKRQGMMKSEGQNLFSKTEILLYSYSKLQSTIQQKKEDISEVEKHGVGSKSKSLVQWNKNNSVYDICDELTKNEDVIKKLRLSIVNIEEHLSMIDAAIDSLKEDQYFEIIPMKYFEGQTREEIAEWFEVDVSTISRNKNRLMNFLKIRLFPDDAIQEMFS